MRVAPEAMLESYPCFLPPNFCERVMRYVAEAESRFEDREAGKISDAQPEPAEVEKQETENKDYPPPGGD